MVDTLVLGTSAKAWEFESLHAQTFNNEPQSGSFLLISGALAQLVAHDTGSVGVRGSNPLRSSLINVRRKRLDGWRVLRFCKKTVILLMLYAGVQFCSYI